MDQGAPQSSQEHPKSSQQEFERAPKRLHNHFWIENADFSQMLTFFQRKINIFEGVRVSLGAQNRPQEVPRGDKKRHRRPQNPPKAIFGSKSRANQAQESSKMNLEALSQPAGQQPASSQPAASQPASSQQPASPVEYG